MVANSCTASTVGVLPAETGPGSGTLKAFQFKWPTTATFEYTAGSTQCVPIPWDTDYKAKLKAFIQAVWTHINGYVPSYPPDHVVVTGINSTTQENLQPYCTPASSTCGIDGVHSDVDNWVTLMISESKCTDYTSCASAYKGLVEGAYTDVIGYWGGTGGFPSSVNLASMFVNSGIASFPFNTTTTLGLALLNEVVTFSSARSIIMNNAAQNGTNGLVNPVRCYQGTQDSGFPCQSPQPTSVIAFQEKIPVVGTSSCSSTLYTLLTTASTDNSGFMETYPSDVNSCL